MFQKNIYFCFTDNAKAFDCVDHNKLWKILKWSEVAQSCPTLCDPMDCSLPGSLVHRIFQATVLEWVTISFSREYSQPRGRTWVSHTAGRRFTIWATRVQEIGIPDHLTWLLRNLYADQEATDRTGHGTTDWFQIGKGVYQSCILSPCLFNLYAEYIMQYARLEEAQAGIKIAGRKINNLR